MGREREKEKELAGETERDKSVKVTKMKVDRERRGTRALEREVRARRRESFKSK